MKVKILRSAKRTIRDGFLFYEEQEPGLGKYFFDSIMFDLHSLRIYGGIHQIVFEKYHRMVCRKFPYSIFYTLEASTVVVYAVLDNRRDPGWISERLN